MAKRYAIDGLVRYGDGRFRPFRHEYHSLKMAADHVMEYLERHMHVPSGVLHNVKQRILLTGELSLDLVGLEFVEELRLNLSRIPCEVQSAIAQRWLESVPPYEDVLAVPECVLLNGHDGDCEVEYI